MPNFMPFLNKEDIENAVAEIAGRASKDYKNRELVSTGDEPAGFRVQ